MKTIIISDLHGRDHVIAGCDQTFEYEADANGTLIAIQTAGPKLTRSQAIEVCRVVADTHGLPVGQVRLRTDYALLRDTPQVTASGYDPPDDASAAAFDDIVAAAARRLDLPPPECNDYRLCVEMRCCAAGCQGEPPDDPAFMA